MVISALFVTCLIAANTIGVKLVELGPFMLPAAVIVFPLSYVIGDIITEVYGFRWARRIIWLGFLCNLFFALFVWSGGLMPAASSWGGQSAYEAILGYTPRLLLASFSGYLAGEFTNSLVLSRLKVATRGRWLWLRTIGSSVVGEGLDSALFIAIAFAGPNFSVGLVMNHWLAKVAIEVLATPFTYTAVGYLKRKEGAETCDDHASLNPFKI
ncbi:MAG: queuosine precursor transporter [Dehalococcoidia bacterium]|nr:queuosine precursor transporter [Dehalococcoidia bacterium]